MTNNTKKLSLLASALLAFGITSSALAADYDSTSQMASPNKMMGTSESDIQKHATDRSVTLMFDKGSANLSAASQESLRNLVTTIGMANISRAEVAAWSDKDFPRTGSDLAKADRDLADQRVTKINDYLKSNLNFSAMNIKNFNMAETSNWLARTFRTDEAELKSVFSKEAVAPMARADFNVMVREGAPMKAVVVFVRK